MTMTTFSSARSRSWPARRSSRRGAHGRRRSTDRAHAEGLAGVRASCRRCSSIRAARTATSRATRRSSSTRGCAHAQNVLRGPEGKGAPGLACATCHATAEPAGELRRAHAARRAQLAPAAAGAQDGLHRPLGRASCAALKDPTENGGKDLRRAARARRRGQARALGLGPGVGRAPVDVPHAEFVAAFKQWMDAGAPCPPQ